MTMWLSTMEELLYEAATVCTTLMEMFGICVLVFTAVRCFIRWIRRETEVRLMLAQGIALALEFKLGGEVLRTVVVREWAELGILGDPVIRSPLRGCVDPDKFIRFGGRGELYGSEGRRHILPAPKREELRVKPQILRPVVRRAVRLQRAADLKRGKHLLFGVGDHAELDTHLRKRDSTSG